MKVIPITVVCGCLLGLGLGEDVRGLEKANLWGISIPWLFNGRGGRVTSSAQPPHPNPPSQQRPTEAWETEKQTGRRGKDKKWNRLVPRRRRVKGSTLPYPQPTARLRRRTTSPAQVEKARGKGMKEEEEDEDEDDEEEEEEPTTAKGFRLFKARATTGRPGGRRNPFVKAFQPMWKKPTEGPLDICNQIDELILMEDAGGEEKSGEKEKKKKRRKEKSRGYWRGGKRSRPTPQYLPDGEEVESNQIGSLLDALVDKIVCATTPRNSDEPRVLVDVDFSKVMPYPQTIPSTGPKGSKAEGIEVEDKPFGAASEPRLAGSSDLPTLLKLNLHIDATTTKASAGEGQAAEANSIAAPQDYLLTTEDFFAGPTDPKSFSNISQVSPPVWKGIIDDVCKVIDKGGGTGTASKEKLIEELWKDFADIELMLKSLNRDFGKKTNSRRSARFRARPGG